MTYQWIIRVADDSNAGSTERIAGGGIERIEPEARLRSRLTAAAPGQRASVLARSGIWYDALDALSNRIDASPRNAHLRNQRAALLEQGGLGRAALDERQAASNRE